MQFMIQLQVDKNQKENVFHKIQKSGIKQDVFPGPKVWVAAKTGLAFILIETDDASKIWNFCSEWADYRTRCERW